jgi:hypothetical protein
MDEEGAVDPMAELFKADITRMAREFWLSVIPTQLGPAIQAWIQDQNNRDEFSKTLSGIGFCDFFVAPDSALSGSSHLSIEEAEPRTLDAQILEVKPCPSPTE